MRSVLGRVRARATGIVMGWSPTTRRQAPWLCAILALFFFHYAVWCFPQPFFIEDSGISFSFARNIASGLGAVPFAGGERVEAYSNASWTFLIAGLYLLHVDPFFAAKLMGALFGSVTLLVSWAIGHEARGGMPGSADGPDADEPIPEWAPMIGPVLLAASTQYTLWAASGLENSLFNLLLGLGIWRLCVEIRTGSRFPWSALAFFLLTMTRPDGLGYAAVGLLARILATARRRQWAALPIWLVVFLIPYSAYNAVRYEYFGWWFPNTYYAKEKNDTVKLLGWAGGGWNQFRNWAFQLGVVFATPAVILALLPLTGTRSDRWRKPLIATMLALFTLGCLTDGHLPGSLVPHLPGGWSGWWGSHVVRFWGNGVVVFLLLSAVILGLLTLVKKGWEARGMLWASFSTGLLFWVWSVGDWMKGFRWGSLVALPLFTLIGLGIGVLVVNLPAAGDSFVQVLRWRLPDGRRRSALIGLGLGTVIAVGYLAGVAIGAFPASNAGLLPHQFTWTLPAWSADSAAKGATPKSVTLHFEILALIVVGPLLGLGLALLREKLPADRPTAARFGSVMAGICTFALALPNTWKSNEFANAPETSVNDVHRRANYMLGVQEKLDVDDVTLLDVDMGAHTYFTGNMLNRWHIGDLAGLIEVPMSRHKSQKSFIDDYIFNELRPTFAHVHGSWANVTHIPQNPKWKEQYLEITGYPSGKRGYHIGNHIRKELVARTDYRGPPGKQVDFDGGVTMAGWDLPAPEIAPGGKLYFHTWWIATPRKTGFRVLVFLKDKAGDTHAMEAAPAQDWYKPDRWKADEYVEGNWYLPVPTDLPQGDYDVGVVVLNPADGSVYASLGAAEAPVRYLAGEWVDDDAVHIVSVDAAMAKANEVLAASLTQAKDGDCEGAREQFKNARRHIARNQGWRDGHSGQMDAALVACYVARADALDNLYGKSEAIAHALRINPAAPTALAAGKVVGKELYDDGMAAREKKDPQSSYTALLAALRADPTLSWARVYLEEERDLRLGISGKEDEKAPPAAKQDKVKVPPRPGKPALPGAPEVPVEPADDDPTADGTPDHDPTGPENGGE